MILRLATSTLALITLVLAIHAQAQAQDRAWSTRAHPQHHADGMVVMTVDGAPDFAFYVAPDEVANINPRARIRGACRTVFDVAPTGGWTQNIASCCAVDGELGQEILELALYSAVYLWGFQPVSDAQTQRTTALTSVIWFDETKFVVDPLPPSRHFLPDPPSVHQCRPSNGHPLASPNL